MDLPSVLVGVILGIILCLVLAGVYQAGKQSVNGRK